MNSTAWDTYRRRAHALRDLIDRIESSGSAELPPTPDQFADRADLLVALYATWTRRLDARVDLALELDEQLPEESVARAWHEVAADMPSLRRLLDRHQDEPALRASRRHEHQVLAVAAGLAAMSDPANHRAAAGERFVRQIRAAQETTEETTYLRLTDRVADLVRRVPMPIMGGRLGA